MKKYFYLLVLSLLAFACSVDRINEVAVGPQGEQGIPGKDGVSTTIIIETADNGYWLIILEDGVETQRVFLRDGVDGKDGLDGLDGIDGQDGQDGASVTMVTEQVEGGWLLFFYVDEVLVSQIFVENGAPGTDGLDGTNGHDGSDGVDGQDGVSTTIQTETTEGGYWIIFFENGEEINRIFVRDGINGEDGEDGQDGTCSCEEDPEDCNDDEDDKVAMCHKQEKDQNNGNGNGPDDDYITIYVNPNAVQAHLNHGDAIGECEDD